MRASDWMLFIVLVALVVAATPVLGGYLARVYGDGRAPGDRVFGPVERLVYRVVGVDPSQEQRWAVYARSVLAFSVVSVVVLYVLQRVQGSLPRQPDRRRRRAAGDGVQHRGELRDEHELAELRAASRR